MDIAIKEEQPEECEELQDGGKLGNFMNLCCLSEHFLEMNDRKVKYVIQENKLFLEKFAAFASLGRMYVVRGSDYRRADKILVSKNMVVDKEFLIDQRYNVESEYQKQRQRRTHISFEAFGTLIRNGFAYEEKKEELLKDLIKLEQELPALLQACKPEKVAKTNPTSNEDDKKVDTKKDISEESTQEQHSLKIFEENVEFVDKKQKRFLKFADLAEFFSEEDKRVTNLKRQLDALDIKVDKELIFEGNDDPTSCFISLEGLIALLEKSQILSKKSGLFK